MTEIHAGTIRDPYPHVAGFATVRRRTIVPRRPTRAACAIPGNDNMSDPTPQETAEIMKSSAQIGGSVKTLSDIRFEKLEARLAQLEQVNAELRAANAELYAYASAAGAPSQSQPAQVQNAPASNFPAGVSAPAPVIDTSAAEAAKAEQDALIEAVKQRMNYTASKTPTAGDDSGM